MNTPHTRRWTGTGVAVVTPFDTAHQPDLQSLRKIVDHLVQGGVEYMVLMGSTGEAAVLSDDEIARCVDAALEQNAGRLPILLGCAGNDTAAVARKMEEYNKRFAVQGYLTASPHYNKPSQEGIYRHYKALSQTTDRDIVLYNVPGRTASNVLPDTICRIAHDSRNIVAVKEASGSIEQGMKILRDKPAHFQVLSGDDPLALAGIACGYEGIISVLGNVLPRTFSDMIRQCLKGDFAAAAPTNLRLIRLIELLFAEGNPGGIKAAMSLRGLCSPQVRLPLVEASDKLTEQLRVELAHFPG